MFCRLRARAVRLLDLGRRRRARHAQHGVRIGRLRWCARLARRHDSDKRSSSPPPRSSPFRVTHALFCGARPAGGGAAPDPEMDGPSSIVHRCMCRRASAGGARGREPCDVSPATVHVGGRWRAGRYPISIDGATPSLFFSLRGIYVIQPAWRAHPAPAYNLARTLRARAGASGRRPASCPPPSAPPGPSHVPRTAAMPFR